MFDSLLELLERDKPDKKSSRSSGGLRSKLANVIDGERDEYQSSERRADDRDRKRDDDDDDDRYDADRSGNRKKKREFDFLEFGD